MEQSGVEWLVQELTKQNMHMHLFKKEIEIAKEMEQQEKVKFACDVYNEHYGKDLSFRSIAESLVNSDKGK